MGLGGALSGSWSKSKTKTAQFTNTNSTQFADDVLNKLEQAFLDELDNYGEISDEYMNMLAKIKGQDFDYDVQPIIRENTRRTENQIAQDYSSLARQAGSDANSLVAAAHSESSADAYSQLAKTSAELEMEAQNNRIAGMTKALEAQGSAQGSILDLGNLLKGARTKSSSSTIGTTRTSSSRYSAGLKASVL